MKVQDYIVRDGKTFKAVSPVFDREMDAEDFANNWRVKNGGITIIKRIDEKERFLHGFNVYANVYNK